MTEASARLMINVSQKCTRRTVSRKTKQEDSTVVAGHEEGRGRHYLFLLATPLSRVARERNLHCRNVSSISELSVSTVCVEADCEFAPIDRHSVRPRNGPTTLYGKTVPLALIKNTACSIVPAFSNDGNEKKMTKETRKRIILCNVAIR